MLTILFLLFQTDGNTEKKRRTARLIEEEKEQLDLELEQLDIAIDRIEKRKRSIKARIELLEGMLEEQTGQVDLETRPEAVSSQQARTSALSRTLEQQSLTIHMHNFQTFVMFQEQASATELNDMISQVRSTMQSVEDNYVMLVPYFVDGIEEPKKAVRCSKNLIEALRTMERGLNSIGRGLSEVEGAEEKAVIRTITQTVSQLSNRMAEIPEHFQARNNQRNLENEDGVRRLMVELVEQMSNLRHLDSNRAKLRNHLMNSINAFSTPPTDPITSNVSSASTSEQEHD